MIIVMAGIPGSGKSTTVKHLVAQHLKQLYTQAAVVSADDFFTAEDGTYDFVLEARGVAHQMCFQRFQEYLARFRAKDLIVVDNTHATNHERARYIDEAALHGHGAKIVLVRCPIEVCIARRDPADPQNQHPIPRETILHMAETFQDPRPEWTVEVFDNS